MPLDTSTLLNRRRIRRTFGKISEAVTMPNLIEVQRHSYDQYLQMFVKPEDRTEEGLQEVFSSIFPIKDFSGRSMLEFVSYNLESPKYDVEECQQRGLTYASGLRVTLRLVVWDLDEDSGTKSVRDMKEQDVYLGEMPLMTPNGTFVVNGVERVIVSQMHRSPGVFFDHDKGKTHTSGKFLFAARVIPYRGSWLDFEFDPKDIINVRIDRRRKIPCTTFLMALLSEEAEKHLKECVEKEIDPDRTKLIGMTREEILNYFYKTEKITKTDKGWVSEFNPQKYRNQKLNFDLINADDGSIVASTNDKVTIRMLKKIQDEGLKKILLNEEQIYGSFLAEDIINEKTGHVLYEAGEELNEESLGSLKENSLEEFRVLIVDNNNAGPWLLNTLANDKNATREEALVDIYRVMRPGATSLRNC